jgi:formylglycine-generating enzyme required for sulfatase activity
MGSPADEPEQRDNERQHKVTIAHSFAIGKTEVTWDQWEACVRDRWCDGVAIEHACVRTKIVYDSHASFTD